MLSVGMADNFDRECPFCGMNPSQHNVEGWEYRTDTTGVLHHPTCPWISMPRIVAALEAAERIAPAFDDLITAHGPDGTPARHANAMEELALRVGLLVAALRGEGVAS
jgi:hypothetical protein